MEKRLQIGIKLPPSLIAEIDAYRQDQEFPPDRTEVIERAVVDWLRRRAADAKLTKAERKQRR